MQGLELHPAALPFNELDYDYKYHPAYQGENVELIKRQHYTCQCCGLHSKPSAKIKHGFMDVVNISGTDYVLCLICAQSQLLQRGMGPGEGNGLLHGSIIKCGLTQAQVSELFIYIALSCQRENAFKDKALALDADLKQHQTQVHYLFTDEQKESDDNVSNISQYANLYKNLTPELKQQETRLFEGMVYYPDWKSYTTFINYMDAGVYHKSLPDISWLKLGEDASAVLTD